MGVGAFVVGVSTDLAPFHLLPFEINESTWKLLSIPLSLSLSLSLSVSEANSFSFSVGKLLTLAANEIEQKIVDLISQPIVLTFN